MSQVEYVNNRCFLTLVFASLFLASVVILPHNAFAMGPSSCYNQYDAPFVSFMINNGTQTFDALANPNLTFNANAYHSFNLTFVMHTPSLSSWGNSDPGAVWFGQNVNNFEEGACLGPVGPNQNITSGEVVGNRYPGIGWIQSITYGTAASMGVTFNVQWISVPSSPQNLMTTASPSQINLSWSSPSSNGGSPITNYNVYRGTSSGSETLLGTIGNVTSYNDTTVTNGQTYFYTVTAVNSIGESPQSNEASATLTTPASTSGDKVIATIPVGNTPTGVAVNPITNMVYVINNTRVFIINGTINALTDTITTGGISSFISNSEDVNPSTNRIYVANYVSNTVSVIDGSTDSIVDKISVTYPMGVKVNPETNMVYVINGGYSVTVINGSTNAVVTKITVPGSSGAGPNGIVVNANTNKIYVSSTGYDGGPIGYLSIIDGASNSLLTSIKIGASGGTLGVNPSVNRIYMTDVDGILFVIDGYTNSIISSMTGFDRSAGIGVDQETDKIYLANYASNTVSVIDGQTNTVTSQIQVGSNPLGIGVDAATNKIYAANSGSATVSVIDGSTSSTTNTVPTAPQNLQAIVASSSQINLSWAVPANDGGSYIEGYKIERSTDEGTTWSTVVSQTTSNVLAYSDTGLAASTTYTYRVSAINAAGTSPPSNTASATTGANASASGDVVVATIQLPITGDYGCCNLLDGVGVNPNTNSVYVANSGGFNGANGGVYIIDGATNNVAHKIDDGGASGVGVNSDTNKIYVANAGYYVSSFHFDYGNTVSVLDGTTNNVTSTITVGREPFGIGINPNTNKIYISDEQDNAVSVVGGATNSVVNTILVETNPREVTVNPSTDKIYVTNWGSGTVSVINGTNAIVNTVQVGSGPIGIGVDPNTDKIYVANNNDNTVSVINGTTDTIVNTIHVGNGPFGIGVNPSTDKIYVANNNDNTVSVINGTTDTIVNTIHVGNAPLFIGVNPNTSMIYIGNGESETVSVIDGSSPTIPQSPTGLTATPKMPPQIDLSWTAPSNNGGSAVTGYMIERSTDNGATWSTIVRNTNDIKTSYTDSHLMPVKTYTYRVSAINGIGTSDPSNTASARPLSAHGH